MDESPAPTRSESAGAPARGSRLRALAPWLVAIAILTWLFSRVPVEELRSALGRVAPLPFAALAVGYAGAVLVADCFAVWASVRYSLPGVPLRYLEVLRIRGASLLLAMLNYGVGQGGVAYFLSRRHAVPISRAAGAVLLNAGVSVLVVALSAGLGVALGGAPGSPALTLAVLGLAAGFPVYLGVIAARPALLTDRLFLRPLFDAGLRGHLVGLAARLPHMAVLLLGNYLAMRAFGIHPPAGRALSLLPVVFVIGVLPVSPSGLGTTQAATVALFAPFAPGATLAEQQAVALAFSVAFQFAVLAVQAVLGVAFLRHAAGAATVSANGG